MSLVSYIESTGSFIYSIIKLPPVDMVASWAFNGAIILANAYRSDHYTGMHTVRSALFCSLFLGSVSFVNYNLKEAKFVDNYDLTYISEVTVYSYPHIQMLPPPLHLASAGLVGLASVSLVRLAINTGYTLDLSTALLSGSSSYMVYKWVQPYSIDIKFKFALLAVPCATLLSVGKSILTYLLPINEVNESYTILKSYSNQETFDSKVADLFIITSNFMVSLAFLGIDLLKATKTKEIMLLNVPDKHSAREFMSTAIQFFFYSLSYTVARTAGEVLTAHAYKSFEQDSQLDFLNTTKFKDGNNFQIISHSNISTQYATCIKNIGSKNYEIIKDKLFSIPKLSLLPYVLQHSPVAILITVGVTLIVDYAKNQLMAAVIAGMENAESELKVLNTKYQSREAHDNANSDSASMHTAFLFSLYADLQSQINWQEMKKTMLSNIKMYSEWMYWDSIFPTLIECAVAKLLEAKLIITSMVFVYNRAVQDSITLMLSRSRSQAELESILADIKKLTDLRTQLDSHKPTLQILKGDEELYLSIEGLQFQRVDNNGTVKAIISVPSLSLSKGIYAVTGPNGAGKSSLFKIISSNIDPYSFNITNPGVIKASFAPADVVVVEQRPYTTLHVKPIEWVTGITNTGPDNKAAIDKATKLLSKFQFGTTVNWEKEQPNLYGSISGGQAAKLELCREVFLKEKCPPVLLLDEPFKELDPQMKQLMQSEIKEFCPDSMILVIYHPEHDKNHTASNCVNSMHFYTNAIEFKIETTAQGNVSKVLPGQLCGTVEAGIPLAPITF